MIDRLIPPHPAHGRSCGRGGEAFGLAMLDGQQALSQVGQRLDERGLVALVQPGLTRAALNDDRLGHLLDALFAAHLNTLLSAMARKAREVSTIPTPWLHQDTTTSALYRASEDEPQMPGAPRPAYGQSQEGRDDLNQGLLRLGVRGEGGVPLRLGVRDGNRSESVETPVASEECLALGLEGRRGIVADSKASSRRTLGMCLEHKVDCSTWVPRPWAIRQALEAWGRQQPTWPLVLETPGSSQDEAPRRWHGQSVRRPVEVEDRDGHVAQAALRFVVGPSRQLAQQPTQAEAAAPEQAAAALAAHVRPVPAQWFACRPAADAAIAAYEGQGQGPRGRRPRLWRYQAVRYHRVGATRPTRRSRRGRPAKLDPLPLASGDRLGVEVEARANAEEANGWTVLATPVDAAVCPDADMLRA
jgi:Domain of unknown function (DUF4277)